MKSSLKNEKINTVSLLREVTSKAPDMNKVKLYAEKLDIQFNEDLNQQMANIMYKMSQLKKRTSHEPSL